MKAIMLTPDNLRVLTAIKNYGPILVPDLLEKIKIDRGKLEGCIETLVSKDLIQKKKKKLTNRILTNRGIHSKDHLAERHILDELANGPIHMKELGKETALLKENLTAGIGILRKSGLVSIEKGIVTIIEKNKAKTFSLDIQKVLHKIDKNGTVKVNPKLSKELELRGFISVNDTSITTVSTIINQQQLDLIKPVVEVSKLTPQMLATGSWQDVSFKPYSLKSEPRRINPGRYNPYRQFVDHLRSKLIGLGFQEMKGPLIEQEFWNFDALFAAQDHPAREDTDILLIKNPTHGTLNDKDYIQKVAKTHENGWKTGSKGLNYRWDPRKAARLLLRPQGTSVSARILSKIDSPPNKFFSIARCFRPDQIDATHDIEFDQIEAIICDPSITFRDLLGMLQTFAVEVAGATKARFRPDFYPFTSPSVELSAEHPILGNIEFGGSGMFRPEVTQPFGIDYPVLAWGIGVGRLFMTKYGITDIRELFSQNLNWLREAKVTSGIQVDELI